MKNKSCPFCGCLKSEVTKYDGDVWRVCCYCGASPGASLTVKEATRKWNAPRPTEAARAAGEK